MLLSLHESFSNISLPEDWAMELSIVSHREVSDPGGPSWQH